MFGQLSLGTLGLVVGSILTVIGVIAYATNNPTLNLAGFFYGIPLILGGLALKVGELKPVPFSRPSAPEMVKLRNQQATVTQTKLRKDVTRYCYGQDVHLDRALEKLGLSPTDDDRPVLTGLREEEIDSAYALVLEFDSPKLPLATWQQKQEKIERYFGPNIRATIAQPADNRIELALITTNNTVSG